MPPYGVSSTSVLRRLWVAVALVACGASATTPVSAQIPRAVGRLGPTPEAAAPWLRALPAPVERPAPGRVFGDSRDHRWEGLAIGASVLGIVGILMADALCNADSTSESCAGGVIMSGVVGAVVGGVIGGFIGSAIPKRGSDAAGSGE